MVDLNKTLAEQLEPMATDLAHKEREVELLAAIEYGKSLLTEALSLRATESMDKVIAQSKLSVTLGCLNGVRQHWTFRFLPSYYKVRIQALLDASL